MVWVREQLGILRRAVETPQLLALIVVIDLAAYIGGLLFWYGEMMADPATPIWAWPFVPDCPLFGLLGGLGLWMAIAQRRWDKETEAQRALVIAGLVSVLLWLSTYWPGVPAGWAQQAGMMGLLGMVLLLCGGLFRRAPVWLLALFAFGQIKYGIWTITAWTLFWRSTAELLGAPLFSAESILMTVSHIGLAAQGLLLLFYLRIDLPAVVVSLAWFALSDFVDYGLGFHPPIPQDLISLPVMQWSTMAVTWLLGAWFGWEVWRQVGNRPLLHDYSGRYLRKEDVP